MDKQLDADKISVYVQQYWLQFAAEAWKSYTQGPKEWQKYNKGFLLFQLYGNGVDTPIVRLSHLVPSFANVSYFGGNVLDEGNGFDKYPEESIYDIQFPKHIRNYNPEKQVVTVFERRLSSKSMDTLISLYEFPELIAPPEALALLNKIQRYISYLSIENGDLTRTEEFRFLANVAKENPEATKQCLLLRLREMEREKGAILDTMQHMALFTPNTSSNNELHSKLNKYELAIHVVREFVLLKRHDIAKELLQNLRVTSQTKTWIETLEKILYK